MHEISLVQSLIEQVESEVKRSGHSGRVTRVELNIGRFSCVHVDSLRFAFETLSVNSILDGAELDISQDRSVCLCNDCQTSTETDVLPTNCPACDSHDIVLQGGHDLMLMSMEIED